MIIRHDRSDRDSLVDETEWLGVTSFFDGDGAGSLIAPAWLLTAAHTARNIPAAHSVPIAGQQYPIVQVLLHPNYEQGSFATVDLALVQLARPVANVQPVGLYDRCDEQGQEVLLLGRGDYGNGIAGIQGTDHTLRRATNRIEEVDAYWIKFRFDPPPACTTLEGVGGEGDSGGPALIWRDSLWLVAGVSSWQKHSPRPLSTYGCIEHYARVSRYVEWIRSICGLQPNRTA